MNGFTYDEIFTRQLINNEINKWSWRIINQTRKIWKFIDNYENQIDNKLDIDVSLCIKQHEIMVQYKKFIKDRIYDILK